MFRDLSQYIIRPILKKDVSALYELAELTGIGLTSLPHDKKYLKKKIEYAIRSLEDDVGAKPKKFLFVLEDTSDRKVIGTTGVKTGLGEAPFYSFKVSSMRHQSEQLDKFVDHKILHLVNDYQQAALLGSLFLHPDYRLHGLGPLLSRVRFLFIAMYKEEFADIVIAELRGQFDKKNRSPFWEYVAKLFFDMPFEDADYLSATASKQFIQDMVPRYPIYTTVLPKVVQNSIAKVHKDTKPAMKMLYKEGFKYKGYIDIFDGGPTIEANKAQIKTIKNVKQYTINKIVDKLDHDKCYMIGIKQPHFLVTAGPAYIFDTKVNINTVVAKKLDLNEGDNLWLV